MTETVGFEVLGCRCAQCNQMFECNDEEWSPHTDHRERVSFLCRIISHPEWGDRAMWITFQDDGGMFIEPVARA